MTAYDWVVVGAGLTGLTVAEQLANGQGARVLVVDQRTHIGGNIYDEVDDNGVLVHKYGPHAFHTGSKPVWDYLSRFTEWMPYEHRVLASIEGKLLPVPYNFTTLEALLPARAESLKAALLARHVPGSRVPVLRLLEDTDPQIAEFGEHVLDVVFRGYSAKQWGRPVEELDRGVMGRVPVVLSYDDRYFRDEYQAIPLDGYTAMAARMADVDGVTVALGEDGHAAIAANPRARALWTGPVDSYFAHEHGHLPYRSLRFDLQTRDERRVQPVAQVNYPGTEPWTRITEHAHFSPRATLRTTLGVEYSETHVPGVNEPFYPVHDDESRALHKVYQAACRELEPKVYFAGRLGDYRYYDMHQAVGRALQLVPSLVAGTALPEAA
ncbi:UDP-galactopyranose mutase [Motilibacter peucedani]|uniref:UDP-galactopyranose mutase n=1 Tax=Motilibacter peucedani TaxID=598650 RepID=A0A420XTT7_9ACTN|nr:UDP-galactopyranose mutase [Motilibacter peucedani]RKS80167.1 UDP-galactopyranose mutase [Motilibacter peucedani]